MEDKYEILVSPAAAEQIKKQFQHRGTPNAYLRLGVQGGGCSGYSYILKFEDSPPHNKDLLFTSQDINVIVDCKSIIYLNGLTLDWEHTLMCQGFKFINPNEISKCGCGTSFSV